MADADNSCQLVLTGPAFALTVGKGGQHDQQVFLGRCQVIQTVGVKLNPNQFHHPDCVGERDHCYTASRAVAHSYTKKPG